MKTGAFGNSCRSAVSDSKTVTGKSVNIQSSAGCTIECTVTNYGIFSKFVPDIIRRVDDSETARHRFAYRVVGFSFQIDPNSFCHENTKALSGAAIKREINLSVKCVV